MRRLLLLIFSAAWYIPAAAQYPGYQTIAQPALFSASFNAAAQKTRTIQCDFIQEKTLSMLSEKIISKGKFWFKKDNLVRMQYFQPFEYLMILANNTVYIKDGQRENKLSGKSNKLFGQINQVIIDCVRGTALSNPDFSVRLFENGSGYLLELSPTGKHLKELFKHINVSIDKKDYSASRLEMLEQSGDDTVITFINKVLNAEIADSLFVIH